MSDPPVSPIATETSEVVLPNGVDVDWKEEYVLLRDNLLGTERQLQQMQLQQQAATEWLEATEDELQQTKTELEEAFQDLEWHQQQVHQLECENTEMKQQMVRCGPLLSAEDEIIQVQTELEDIQHDAQMLVDENRNLRYALDNASRLSRSPRSTGSPQSDVVPDGAVEQLRNDIEQLEEQLKSREAERTRHDEEVTQLGEVNTRLQAQVKELQRFLPRSPPTRAEMAANEADPIRKEMERLADELSKLQAKSKEDRANHTTELQQAVDINIQLHQQVSELQAAMEHNTEQEALVAQLQDAAVAYEAERTQRQAELDALVDDNTRWQQELEEQHEAVAQVTNLHERIGWLEQELCKRPTADDYTQVEEEGCQAREKVEWLEDQLEAANKRLTPLQDEARELGKRLAATEGELKTYQAALEESMRNTELVSQDNASLRDQIGELQTRAAGNDTTLQQKVKELEAKVQSQSGVPQSTQELILQLAEAQYHTRLLQLEHQRALQEQVQKNEQLESKLRAKGREVDKGLDQLRNAQSELQHHRATAEQEKRRLGDMEGITQQLQNDVNTAREKQQAMEAAHSEELADMEEKMQQLRQTVQTAQQSAEKAGEYTAEVEGRAQGLKEQLRRALEAGQTSYKEDRKMWEYRLAEQVQEAVQKREVELRLETQTLRDRNDHLEQALASARGRSMTESLRVEEAHAARTRELENTLNALTAQLGSRRHATSPHNSMEVDRLRQQLQEKEREVDNMRHGYMALQKEVEQWKGRPNNTPDRRSVRTQPRYGRHHTPVFGIA